MNALKHLSENWATMSEFDRKRFIASNLHVHGEYITLSCQKRYVSFADYHEFSNDGVRSGALLRRSWP